MQTRKDVIGFAWGLGYRIAVPIVFLALGGRVLDKKLGSAPIFLLAGIFLAMTLSFFLIWRLVKQIETERAQSEIEN